MRDLTQLKRRQREFRLALANLTAPKEGLEPMTQKAIAAALGVSATHLSLCGSAKSNPSQVLIAALRGLHCARELDQALLRLEEVKKEVRKQGPNRG